jgi:redox-sensing transcriptional repressor
MGQALSNYTNFSRRGFNLVGIFDVNPKVVGTKIKGIEVMHSDKLDEFVKDYKVDIAILSTPFEQTQAVAERVAELGIKGIWNFSPMDLKLNHNVIIENVHLSDSLMVLGYKLDERFGKDEE